MVFAPTGFFATVSHREPALNSDARTAAWGVVDNDLGAEWREIAPPTTTQASSFGHPKTRLVDKLGNYHCNNRVYSINAGRWLSPDQAKSPWWNLANYASHRPLQLSDPTGLDDKDGGQKPDEKKAADPLPIDPLEIKGCFREVDAGQGKTVKETKNPGQWDAEEMKKKCKDGGNEVLKLKVTVYNCAGHDKSELETELKVASNVLLQCCIELEYEFGDTKDCDPKKKWYGFDSPKSGNIIIIGKDDSEMAKDAKGKENDKANGYGEKPGKRSGVWGTGVKGRVIAHELGHNADLDHPGHTSDKHVMGCDLPPGADPQNPPKDGYGWTEKDCTELRKMAGGK